MSAIDAIRALPEAKARPAATETLLRDFPTATAEGARTFLRGLPIEAATHTGTISAAPSVEAPATLGALDKRMLELKLAGLGRKAERGVAGAHNEHAKLSRFLGLVDRMGVKAAAQMSGYDPEA